MTNDPIRLRHTRSTQVEDLMTQWRVHWEYEENYSLDDIVMIDGQQVRDQANLAPHDVVDQYAEQARNGSAFPPIVLARDQNNGRHSMIDGNTRYAMARKLEQATFPVYIAHVSSMDYAKALGSALNQLGGRRLTETEAMNAALNMLSDNVNFNNQEIAQAVGVTESRISQWRKEKEASDYATELGVAAMVAAMPPRQRKMMTKIKLAEPFKAVAELASSRRIKNDDLKDLVEEIVQAQTEERMLEAISTASDELPAGGPSGAAPVANAKARHMRMILPQIHNMLPPEHLYDADRAEDDAKSWMRVYEVAHEMLNMYRRHGVNVDGQE